MNPETRSCQNCKQQFVIDAADFDFYAKISVPPPTWCPDCRMRRRLSFRNERKVWMRPDSQTGNNMFSGMPPRLAMPVYTAEFWRSDAWDPGDYARDYDFSRPFFEQFKELWYSVPWPGQSTLANINSEYCDQAGYCKNSYLCFNADKLEDCAYTLRCSYLNNCFDMIESFHNELCYESIMIDDCYQTFFSMDCEHCTNVWFSRDLTACSNCFGCTNLRNKQYCIWNEQYTKEDYLQKLAELTGSWKAREEAEKKVRELWLRYPVKNLHGLQNYNSYGEHLHNTKGARHSYSVQDSENVKYSQWIAIGPVKDSYDYSVWGNAASLVYESLTCGEQINGLKFCFDCWPSCRDLEYSVFCRGSSNLFGCVGLKKKQFCIFNKQYSEEDYWKLRERIIAQMAQMPYLDKAGRTYGYGEFFPPEFSPFAYNETMLQDLFPLSKEQAEIAGYIWSETDPKEYIITMPATDLSDKIADTSDDVLKQIIGCLDCRRAYRIIRPELDFLRRMNIPIPRYCLECRTRRRMDKLNLPQYREQACMCGMPGKAYANTTPHFHEAGPCPNVFQTSYPENSPEIVYCEQCYQAEVV